MTCPEEGHMGTTTLVVGEDEVSRKSLCTIKFTKLSSTEDIMDLLKFVPRSLLGAAGFV